MAFSTFSFLRKTRPILWAPWRMEYIENAVKPCQCIFCVKPEENCDKTNLIVFRGSHVFVILNRYPYNNGHVMIVPYRHTSELRELSKQEQNELIRVLALSQEVLRRTLKPHGFNIGMNIGKVAGAGIDDHLHFHLVPRWNGDTNFMPITGNAKVVSEGLEDTREKLARVFQELKSNQLKGG